MGNNDKQTNASQVVADQTAFCVDWHAAVALLSGKLKEARDQLEGCSKDVIRREQFAKDFLERVPALVPPQDLLSFRSLRSNTNRDAVENLKDMAAWYACGKQCELGYRGPKSVSLGLVSAFDHAASNQLGNAAAELHACIDRVDESSERHAAQEQVVTEIEGNLESLGVDATDISTADTVAVPNVLFADIQSAESDFHRLKLALNASEAAAADLASELESLDVAKLDVDLALAEEGPGQKAANAALEKAVSRREELEVSLCRERGRVGELIRRRHGQRERLASLRNEMKKLREAVRLVEVKEACLKFSKFMADRGRIAEELDAINNAIARFNEVADDQRYQPLSILMKINNTQGFPGLAPEVHF